ncbi:MAG TPA: helix-turn-helix domain-containing protein [Pseudonocardiaceae bacterium]|nr:helix-turn-helix domain-containing protein [Pseudonocardiaceae bacterium]
MSDPTSAGQSAVPADVDITTPADVGRELKRIRLAADETQAQSAGAIGVSRANLAQWETGRYLPSNRNARQLDAHFNVGNTLVNLVNAARSPQGQGSTAVAKVNSLAAGDSLLDVFHQVGTSMVDYLIRDEDGNPTGWRHNLQKDQHQTALSTAYGVKTMLVVGDPYIDYGQVATSLLSMQSPEGGWRGRAGSSRPEITAAVLDALYRIGTVLSVDAGLSLMQRELDNFSRTRPYLLSSLLQTALRLGPDTDLAEGLIGDLLAARLNFEGSLLWPEKAEPDLIRPEPSVAHTARAVVALRDVLRVHDRDDVRDAVGQAVAWLVARDRPDDGVIEELIRPRPGGHGTTRVTIRHFTAAWVVQALSGTAWSVPVARLQAALRTVWSRYDRDLGLWSWGNGDLPVWMTLDAVTALRAAALATATPPVSPTHDQ